MHCFKSVNQVKSTQNKKRLFFEGNDLKLTQAELFSFFHFKGVRNKVQILFVFKPKTKKTNK